MLKTKKDIICMEFERWSKPLSEDLQGVIEELFTCGRLGVESSILSIYSSSSSSKGDGL